MYRELNFYEAIEYGSGWFFEVWEGDLGLDQSPMILRVLITWC